MPITDQHGCPSVWAAAIPHSPGMAPAARGQAYEQIALPMGAILNWNPNTSSSILLIYKYKGW